MLPFLRVFYSLCKGRRLVCLDLSNLLLSFSRQYCAPLPKKEEEERNNTVNGYSCCWKLIALMAQQNYGQYEYILNTNFLQVISTIPQILTSQKLQRFWPSSMFSEKKKIYIPSTIPQVIDKILKYGVFIQQSGRFFSLRLKYYKGKTHVSCLQISYRLSVPFPKNFTEPKTAERIQIYSPWDFDP